MYLKVQYNNSIKQYTLTNNYNKPYIKVSNSILPLTTNTTNGIHLNIYANNTTYRPLEYQSMSTSNTYYTSGINSNGLSSTTALTRSSTSSIEYLTCSSTSATSYLTCSSTSRTSYLTEFGNNTLASYSSYGWANYVTQRRYSYAQLTFIPSSGNQLIRYTSSDSSYYTVSSLSDSTYCLYTRGFHITCTTDCYTSARTYYATAKRKTGQYVYSTFTETYTPSYSGSYQGDFIFSSTSPNIPDALLLNWITTSALYGYSTFRRATAAVGSTYYYVNTFTIMVTQNVFTTGTSYLTRKSTSSTIYYTRSSTSSTIYYTCSSTSGYSGISSSSSESSGWL